MQVDVDFGDDVRARGLDEEGPVVPVGAVEFVPEGSGVSVTGRVSGEALC